MAEIATNGLNSRYKHYTKDGAALKSAAEKLKESAEPAKELASKAAKSSLPSPPSAPSLSGPSVKLDISSEAKTKATEDSSKAKINKQAIKEKAKEAAQKIEKPSNIEDAPKRKIKSPAIFFIKGMDYSSGISGGIYNGMPLLAETVEGSRLYGWDQKDEIIDRIKRTAPDQPVVLVGHSFGGDTAVEIANDLYKLENGFRQVNLLVTIDSVGEGNDIIPPNVKKNLNFFGEKSGMLNDGPNIAKDAKKTAVENVLRSEKHSKIDDASEVQADIIHNVQGVLFGHKMSQV